MVAGLGNPGRNYERTRHNVGFRVVEELARRLGAPPWRSRGGAAQTHVSQERVLLLRPLSFMNDSGRPIAAAAAWWKTPPSDILVVSDDLDLPFGKLRMRARGGSGGHNGLRSVIDYLGENFARLRVGIGRGRSDAIDYVLSTFTPAEETQLAQILDVAVNGIVGWLAGETNAAIEAVNGWRSSVCPMPPSDSP